MEPQLQASSTRRVSTVMTDIVADLQRLIRQEVQLAKEELKQDWVRGKNAASLFGGALFALAYGGGFILLALAHGLFKVGFPMGFAYLVIGLLSAAVSVACWLLGRRWLEPLRIRPDKMLENVQENVEWLKTRT